MLTKVGLYSWAGPQTIRLLKTKYFNPVIDVPSLLHAYDYKYLKELKETFGITDAWVTYSWGFSDEHEQEGYEFILSKLKNFKKLNIKTHAYLQGTNLVYEDFKNEDFWCKDNNGRSVTYYKGRKVTCVNNPHFTDFFFKRLAKLCMLGFDGIYVDNVQMGQLGVPMPGNQLPFVFTGCNCNFCQEKFRALYDSSIPKDLEKDLNLTRKYLTFRSNCLNEFIKNIAEEVHKAGKLFGTNGYDPKFNSAYVYGFELEQISKVQDYLLVENHSLSANEIHNGYIDNLSKKIKTPVYVVSYNKGIGYETQYTQKQFDLIYSEAKTSHFFPIIKGSEYTTQGIWHNLYIERINTPRTDLLIPKKKIAKSSRIISIFKSRILRSIVKRYYNQGYTLVMENKYIRPFMSLVYVLVLH